MVAHKRGEDEGKLKARIELADRHPDFVYMLRSNLSEKKIVHILYTVCTQAYFLFLFLHLHLFLNCSNTSVFHRSLVPPEARLVRYLNELPHLPFVTFLQRNY